MGWQLNQGGTRYHYVATSSGGTCESLLGDILPLFLLRVQQQL